MFVRQIVVVAFLLFALQGMAQNDEQKKENWAVGGFLMLLAPEFDHYDKDLVRYDPPSPMLWLGGSWINNGTTGDRYSQIPLRNGVFRKLDVGFTIFQLSRISTEVTSVSLPVCKSQDICTMSPQATV